MTCGKCGATLKFTRAKASLWVDSVITPCTKCLGNMRDMQPKQVLLRESGEESWATDSCLPGLREEFRVAWNKSTEETRLDRIRVLMDGRERTKMLDARLKESFFLGNWRAAVNTLIRQGGGIPDVDWFLEPGNVWNILNADAQ